MMVHSTAAKQASKAIAAAKKAPLSSKSAPLPPSLKSRVAAAVSRGVPADSLSLHYRTVPTPLGPFSLYVDNDGAIRCCHWQLCPAGDAPALTEEQHNVCASLQSRWYKNTTVTMSPPTTSAIAPGEEAAALLERYFNPRTVEDGRPEALEALLLKVPVAYPPTTTFITTTWDVLRRTVPSGQTISYKGLGVRVNQALSRAASGTGAAVLSTSSAPRAIGAAMGANPIPVIVPCHRVLSTTHSLRGYGLGLRYKVWLLRHEQADVPTEKLRVVETETAVSTEVSRR